MVNYEPIFSNIARGMKRSEIRELLKLTAKPGIISFAGGLPAPDLFPVEEIKEMSRIVLDREGKTALQYGPTEGDNRLREELAKLMQKDGVDITSNHLLIVTSSQQGLDLVGKIFIDPGDVVMTSRPTYVGAIQAFNSYGAKMIGIDQDQEGTQTALLEAEIEKLAAKGSKPKFIYEIPDFQNPSGITMSLKRRKELLRIAEKHDLVIVEDSPYRQLRFEGKTEPALIGMNSERVLSLFTFSKILLPGFRLGWMAGPNELIQKAVTAKQSVDLCSPPFNQAILYEYLNRGLLEKQITVIIKAYREKRDFMLSMLSKYMPKLPGLSWTHPQGGLFLWVTLPEHMDAGEMFHAAIEKQVAYVVGTAFYPDGGGRNCFRMNFSYSSMAEIEEGIQRLTKVIGSWKESRESAIITP
ncbi:MAG: PLP-dependent aminotransferase family protein [Acidobacteria bacterium]|jgi:2-aminoadipate transaminase|nr:PLP-dependent aminotransferase family protein [Acidobacteriota bacterium]